MENVEIKQSKNKILIPTIVGGVVLIAVILLVILLVGGGSKRVIKTFAKGLEKQDAEKMCKVLNTDMLESQGYDDECDKYFDDDESLIFKTIKIGEGKKLDKDDIEDIAEVLEGEGYIDDEKDLKAVVRYKFSFKVKEEGDDEYEKVTEYVFVGKIKGKWSIIAVSGSKEYDDDFDIF